MKGMIVFIGLLTVLGGLLPLLNQWEMLPEPLKFVPTEGGAYQMIIVLIGVIGIIYGWKLGRRNPSFTAR